MPSIYESEIEEMAIAELTELGYHYISGYDLAPETAPYERQSFSDAILRSRLQSALERLNPHLPQAAIATAFKAIVNLSLQRTVASNEQFHKYLIEGVPVEYRKGDSIVGDFAYIFDKEGGSADRNDYLVVNQFTIIENGTQKRPDVIIFVNGLPVVLFELKNPVDANATVAKAYEQIQTYKEAIPQLFVYNEICVISDGLEAKVGSYTAPYSRYSTWKTKDGKIEASRFEDQLSVTIHGLFNKQTLRDYLTYFVTYEKTKVENTERKVVRIETVKKIAAYHQYYAVNKAVNSTIEASSVGGSQKAGVVWHTQGSGKSLSMAFYAGKLIQKMDNPTIVVITDRNDLDDQLFGTFAGNSDLLRQPPQQAENSTQLQELLSVASGGVIFSTIQKFSPDDGSSTLATFSQRRNIIVMADEAHRTQYGFDAKLQTVRDENKQVVGQRIAYGFAKYLRDALPNATFIGFTGTPVESKDANTPAVFGSYIDIYDIAQAIEDKITVKIFYESRLAKLTLSEEGKALVEQFDTELEAPDETDDGIDSASVAKAKWTTLERIVGNKERIQNLAADIVSHYEGRQEIFRGKAMIVAMSRQIAVDLYDAIVALRPDWHDDDLSKGAIKVIMTSASSDGPRMQKHHTTKSQRKMLAQRMKDENDPLRIVIVRDMWLTGFDAPCLNTMYVDKPMQGHNLMQAIARVNRVFKDKPGGLIVDYIGIGTSLREALHFYAESGGKGMPAESQQRAVEIMTEKLEVVRQILRDFDYTAFFTVAVKDKLSVILRAENYILGLENGKHRYLKEVTLLGQAYALSKPDPLTFTYADEIAFFQAVKARLSKFDRPTGTDRPDYDSVIKNIVASAIESDRVIDVFEAAGMEKPDISILSEQFLQEVRTLEYKNIALELLKKLLADEVRLRTKRNIAQSRTLMEMLDRAVNRYQNNLLSTAEVIDELIHIAKELRAADDRTKTLNMTSDELAFYDALCTNDSASEVMGDDQLQTIAREVAEKVRKNATIDWAVKESVRARLMVIVRRILKKYGYPPDKQEKAIALVLKQAENLADDWASAT